MILETIGKNNKITLTMQNISGQFIAFCNKFIIGRGSENMNVNYLLIQPDDTDLILDSFSQVFLFLLSLIKLMKYHS